MRKSFSEKVAPLESSIFITPVLVVYSILATEVPIFRYAVLEIVDPILIPLVPPGPEVLSRTFKNVPVYIVVAPEVWVLHT